MVIKKLQGSVLNSLLMNGHVMSTDTATHLKEDNNLLSLYIGFELKIKTHFMSNISCQIKTYFYEIIRISKYEIKK